MGNSKRVRWLAADTSPVAKIEAFLDKIEILQTLQDKSGIKKLYISGGIAFLLVLFILFGFGAGVLCNFVGSVYPAYASFKALENDNHSEDRLWLTYWVVYSSFCLIEGFLEYILFWVPFYYPIKLAFLFYLFLPHTKGAMQLYQKFLQPALRPYISVIEEVATDAAAKVNDLAGQATSAMAKESVKAD